MITVIGIDPSFTCTGVCVWVDGKVRTFSVRTPATDPRAYRELFIIDSITPWLAGGPVVGVVEGVYASKFNLKTSLQLAGLHDILLYQFTRRGYTVGVPAAKSAKKFATGNGNASKAGMFSAAREHLGITVGNHDEADALWLCAMGVYTIGGHINHWAAPAVPTAIDWIPGRPGQLLGV